MLRGLKLSWLIGLLALAALLTCLAQAQGGGTGDDPPPADGAQPAPAPEPRPQPKQKPPAQLSKEQQAAATASAANFTKALRDQLQAAYDPRGRDLFASGDNMTILSVPDGFAVYIASVDDIQSSGGDDPVVEEALFQQGNLFGNTPLTVKAEPGDYVIGLRALKRGDGFDGGCVRKTTRDAITGGVGRSYHLYGVTKLPGKYLCLVANFAAEGAKPEELGDLASGSGLFEATPNVLTALLADRTHAPEDQIARLGPALLRTGRAFYEVNGAAYYCRLGIEGADLTLQEWPVE